MKIKKENDNNINVLPYINVLFRDFVFADDFRKYDDM